jgi:gluconokinase
MLLILFGLPGTGKNYVGDILRDDYGFHFYDADPDAPPALKAKVRRGEPLTDEDRDQWFALIADRVKTLQLTYVDIAVSQGTFREKHRRYLLEHFPAAKFVLITASPDVRIQRLSARADHIISAEYALKTDAMFEPPHIPYVTLDNSGTREDVKAQLERLLTSPAE